MERPDFSDIKSYEEFSRYYWYLAELKTICKALGIEYQGGKTELCGYIKEYFSGNIIKHRVKGSVKKSGAPLTLETSVYSSGFACRNEYRAFFAQHTGDPNFHYTADMTAAVKKARLEKDEGFTVRGLVDVYLGKSDYARYDASSCQWNAFYRAFCADKPDCKDKLRIASALWKLVRVSDQPKVYSRELYEKYKALL